MPTQIRTATRLNNIRRSFVREILKMTERPDMISFAGGLPSPKLIPVEAIAEATRVVLEENGREALQYSTSEGYTPLRQWIADRYAKGGITVSAEQIMITSGSQQGIDLLGKVLLDRGDHVILEQPTYIAAIQAFAMYEPVFHSIPTDDGGIDAGAVAVALRAHPDTRMVYCMPNFQNPSGVSYSADRRKLVADAVRDSNAVLVEDDPYGELRFAGETPPSLARHLPERTVLLGSFSKIVSPGVRIGWICVPPELMEKLTIAKQAADLHSNTLLQRVIYRFLCDNDFEAHLSGVRETYRRQCAAMLGAIDSHFPPDVRCTRPDGGMFLWATLPPGRSALDLFHRAVEQGVCFVPGSAFHATGGGENTMRLNFSNCDEARIEAGIRRLAFALDETGKRPASPSVQG